MNKKKNFYQWKYFVASVFFLLIYVNVYSQPDKENNSLLPNIVVFVADDAGWRDFGCYGNTSIKTPNIDALARGGLKVQRAFLTTPQCSPSRTSMLTGEYAHTLLTEDLHTPLREGKKTVAAYLKKAGYYSGLIRKSHIGPHALKQFNYHHSSSDESQMPEVKNFLINQARLLFFCGMPFQIPTGFMKRALLIHPTIRPG